MTQGQNVFATGILPGQSPLRRITVPEGLSIEDMIARTHASLCDPENCLRVHLVSPRGEIAIEPHLWPYVKPKPGVSTRIVELPTGDRARQVLSIVVSVAALYLTGPVGGALSITGQIGLGVVTAGLTVVGQLLVNALIPLQPPGSGSSAEARRNVYSIQGWRNDARLGECIPSLHGELRYAPPFAATSYTQIVGDQQFVIALFTLGHGAGSISGIRIGDSPVEDFQDVEFEVREGRVSDERVSLYPRQVLEDADGMELIRPFPRDAEGEIIEDAPSEARPITRFTAKDSTEASVIFSFPQGLFSVDDDADVQSQTVSIQIRQRQNGVGEWQDVDTLDITSNKRDPIFRQHSWALPSRGQWQIQIEKLTDDQTETNRSDRVILAAVQSVRPEYPINIDTPLTLLSFRVRATYQLNGTLDNVSCLYRREGQIWTGSEWVIGHSRYPVTAFLQKLRGPENPFPAEDFEIDWDIMAEWYEFCVDNDLKFDHAFDEGVSLGEALQVICAAGRASPRHDGQKWSVVIDRPDLPVIEHFSDENTAQFSWSLPYFDPPDGMRVRFLDETNDHRPVERIVPYPGFVGTPVLTEEIAMIGKTDPDEIYRETTRRMLELKYRNVSYSVIAGMRSRVATRGDKIMASFNELDETHHVARVRSLSGRLIGLDRLIDAGVSRGLRFKDKSTDSLLAASVVVPINDSEDVSDAVVISEQSRMPNIGDLVHIGPLTRDSVPLRIREIEPAEDFNCRIVLVPDAPEIDDEISNLFIPPWNGRVGAEFPELIGAPAKPRAVRIRSGINAGPGYGRNGLLIMLEPSPGQSGSVDRFQVDIKISGSTVGQTFEVPAASGALQTRAYDEGDIVSLSFAARATNGEWSDFTDPIDHVIGGKNPPPPEPEPTQ